MTLPGFEPGTSRFNSKGSIKLCKIVFQDLCKFAKGESKGELEIVVIQSIIRHGIDREELRDEIYVQCVRQINNNPSTDQASRLWLLLCLVVVAFPPGKSFFKVSNISFSLCLSKFPKGCEARLNVKYFYSESKNKDELEGCSPLSLSLVTLTCYL